MPKIANSNSFSDPALMALTRLLIPYVAFFSAQFRVLLQYRAGALANVVTQFVFGYVHIMVFEAFYASSTASMPMSLREVIIYVWLTQGLLAMQPWGIDLEIRDKVRTGAIGYELLRPLKLYTLLYTRAMAMRTAPTLLRAIPLFAITFAFFGMELPPTWASAAAYLIATFSALLLSAALTAFGSIVMFWTISGDGIGRLMPICIIIFSGMLLPIPLCPEWAQPILQALPFRGLIDTPYRLYLGHLAPSELPRLLAHQLIWTGIIILWSRWLLSRNVRKLVIQGG
ncbi:MAG: ABC-2 family transporter protein [Gemmatimonadetes bacterium]|nr:ABC-2 family transporter protein [Gemmatimonadota bacterium]